MRNRIYDLFFLAFLVLVLYGVCQLLAPFSGAILSSLVCAIMFYPLYEALRRWFPHRRPAYVALVADLLVLIVFVTPMILLTWAVVQESSYLGPAIKQGNITLAQWHRGVVADSLPGMGPLQRVLERMVGMTHVQFQENVVERVSNTLEAIAAWGTQAAHRAVFFLFDLLGMFFILFFLFKDGDKWFDYIHDLIPMNRSDKEHLMARVHNTVIGVSRGWFLTALVQGVTATVGYFAVGLEGAVLLGALTAFFGLLPGVGTVVIWVPVAIFLLAKGWYWRSAFVLVWGALIIVGLIDSIARSYLIGKRLELPLFVLFFALLGGVIVWGAKGIIIGPILVAISPVLLDIYRERYLRSPEIKSNGTTHDVKIAGFIIIVMNLLMGSPLRADPPRASGEGLVQASLPQTKHEGNLERMQADRGRDNEHTRLAQEEFRKGTVELSDDDGQQLQNVQDLKSADRQVAAGQIQKTVARQTYKEAVHNYGSEDPRSAVAKESWKQSQQAMSPLLQNQRQLKEDVHEGGRLVHNDKVELSFQKRVMDSETRYRAADDRKLQKEEKRISDDRNAMSEKYPAP